MNGLHLFIDESNLRIQAQEGARLMKGYDEQLVLRLRIRYGGLLDLVRTGRDLGSATIVGSRPPAGDVFWQKMQALGITPKVFDRVFKEKRVDAEMTNSIRDCLEENVQPGIIALVAGDQDYIPTLERVLKRGWKVEIYFWRNASGYLKRLVGACFTDLSPQFDSLTFLEKPRAPGVREGGDVVYETADE